MILIARAVKNLPDAVVVVGIVFGIGFEADVAFLMQPRSFRRCVRTEPRQRSLRHVIVLQCTV